MTLHKALNKKPPDLWKAINRLANTVEQALIHESQLHKDQPTDNRAVAQTILIYLETWVEYRVQSDDEKEAIAVSFMVLAVQLLLSIDSSDEDILEILEINEEDIEKVREMRKKYRSRSLAFSKY